MREDLAAAAAAYVPLTVPLEPCGKKPAVRAWPTWAATPESVRRYWAVTPDANVGIRTGGGLVVLDVDPRAGGHDLLADLENEHGPLPPTVEVLTGGGGRHLYFRGPADFPSFDVGAGLEVKARGRQVVAPPSVHPDTGAPYAWREGRGPGQIARADLPGWLAAERQAEAPREAPAGRWAAVLATGVVEGGRNVALTALVGHLLARRVDPLVAREIARMVAQHRCRPPLDPREVDRIVESIAGRELRKRGAAA